MNFARERGKSAKDRIRTGSGSRNRIGSECAKLSIWLPLATATTFISQNWHSFDFYSNFMLETSEDGFIKKEIFNQFEPNFR